MYMYMSGLEIDEKLDLQSCDKIHVRKFNFSFNFTNFRYKVVMLQCVVSGLAKQNMSPQHLCVCKETTENGE